MAALTSRAAARSTAQHSTHETVLIAAQHESGARADAGSNSFQLCCAVLLFTFAELPLRTSLPLDPCVPPQVRIASIPTVFDPALAPPGKAVVHA